MIRFKKLLRQPLFWLSLIFLLTVWSVGHGAARSVVDSQRAGCVRAMQSNFIQIEFSYTAYYARLKTAREQGEPADGPDNVAARSYLALAKNMMKRVDAAHSLQWPNPLSEKGPYTHPLGYGTFKCNKAYPDPPIVRIF